MDFIKLEFEKSKNNDPKKNQSSNILLQKILPKIYSVGNFGGWIKSVVYLKGIKQVVYRQVKKSDMRVVAHKSTALAAQNFLVSMAGYGYDTCTMEGFDSKRVKKTLNLVVVFPKQKQKSF